MKEEVSKIRPTNNQAKNTPSHKKKKKKKPPAWLTKSQLWCYEKVILVQVLTMLAMEPIIARL